MPNASSGWLICETRDDKGNAVLYDYKPEDGAGVDLTRAHERNRGAARRSAPHGQPLPQAHPLRQPHALARRHRAAAALSRPTPRSKAPAGCSRSSSTTASTTSTHRHRPKARAVDLPSRPVLHLPRRLRGPHLPPLPARADVPSFRAGTWRRQRLPRALHRLHLFRRASPPDPRDPIHSFLRAVTQSGYRRQAAAAI